MFKVNANLKQAEAAVWVTEISGEAPAQVVWLFQRRMIGDLQDLRSDPSDGGLVD